MLQTQTVKPELLITLRKLMALNELSQFYLVGGTALALLYGHRNSVDIDLFTFRDFDTESLQKILLDKFQNTQITGDRKIMLFAYINDIKVDFVNNKTTLIYPVNEMDGIRFADVKDIAALKLKAIFQRGSKKDFTDLYVLLKHYKIEELLNFFSTAFPGIDVGQLLLSMQYFGDAEETLMPELHIKTDWNNIKKEVAQKVIRYIKS